MMLLKRLVKLVAGMMRFDNGAVLVNLRTAARSGMVLIGALSSDKASGREDEDGGGTHVEYKCRFGVECE